MKLRFLKIKFAIRLLWEKLFKENNLYIENGTSLLFLKKLKEKNYKIGRGVDAVREISLNSTEVSRVHANIFKNKFDYYLVDNFSKNGSFLNGERLAPGIPYILIHNDTLEIGEVFLKYVRE